MSAAGDGDTGLLAPMWAGTAADRLTGDRAFLHAMLDVEVALVRAQAGLGIVPAGVVRPIADAAAGGVDIAVIAARARDTGTPVAALVGELTAAVGDPDAAGYVHLGATSQDIVDSAMMLVAARALRAAVRALDGCATALTTLAGRHRDTPMAARTLGQHAVPTTFGLKAAGWLALVRAARARAEGVCLPVQLGGAAGTLASFVEHARLAGVPGRASALPAAVAAELGLAEPVLPWHTLRTPVADLAAVATVACGAAGKIGLDVQQLSRTDVDELREPAADGRGGSSTMPQKRNPVLATLLVAAARQVPAHAAVLGQAMLAEDERAAGAWHAEWQPLRECLRLTAATADTLAELVAGLQVRPEAMRANLERTGGAIVSERLAAVLSPMIGRRAAKQVIGDAARRAAGGGTFEEALLAAPELAGHLDAAGIRDLLVPEHYLGEAAALVDRMVQDGQR